MGIVAIADCCDALRGYRPCRRSLEMSEILAGMQKEAGRLMTQAAAEG